MDVSRGVVSPACNVYEVHVDATTEDAATKEVEMTSYADAYFSYHPTVMPEKPVVIVGSQQTHLGLVVAKLGCLTGLTVIEVDRWVEHTAGRSVQAIVRDRGEGTLRAMRLASFDQAIANKPPAIVALDEGFAHAAGADALRFDRATIFWLQCEDSTPSLDGTRSPVVDMMHAALRSVRHLGAPWLRRSGGSRSDHRQMIRADGKHPWTTAKEILRLI